MLEVKNLHVSYGEVKAVKGISLNVKQGQLVSLVGSNGAGKTTILRTISGLIGATQGSITFGGKELLKLGAHQVTRTGLIHVPEGRMLIEDMTVNENLRAGAFCRNDKSAIEEDILEVEERFPILRQRAKQKARTLSGGERQMLAIARAQLARPRLLMLDEPSLGLAPLIVQEMFRTLSELKKSGTTILLVEQNAYGALAIADYAYVLRVGEVVAEDTAKNLLENRDFLDAYLGEQ
ncbi:ABC transporter ATP-binding protein [Pseudohalocynthiibacter sp. F2068]|nr:ABC transporter ATP-binding protein [Pseudohalocynthiibacter sp. F2068]MCK0103248.1 ABC transporter ATP-binding protein [Pseudohalocynthiibacter sp. F2068]